MYTVTSRRDRVTYLATTAVSTRYCCTLARRRLRWSVGHLWLALVWWWIHRVWWRQHGAVLIWMTRLKRLHRLPWLHRLRVRWCLNCAVRVSRLRRQRWVDVAHIDDVGEGRWWIRSIKLQSGRRWRSVAQHGSDHSFLGTLCSAQIPVRRNLLDSVSARIDHLVAAGSTDPAATTAMDIARLVTGWDT